MHFELEIIPSFEDGSGRMGANGLESYLEEHYQITNAVAQELTGLSAATIRRYLQLFVNQGLLEKSGTTKNTLYSLIFRS